MDNYTKGEVREVEEPPAFDLKEETICMRVSSGSKMRNLMGFAIIKMKQLNTREMVWNGTGNAVTKTMSCVDIMKRKFKDLHQITKLRYRRIEEYWEPKMEGLERLKVNRDIPAISILLSKDPLDKTDPGYQPPGSSEDTRKEIVRNGKPRKPRIPEQRDKAKQQADNDNKKNTENKQGENQNKPNRSDNNRKRGQGSWRGRGQGRGNTSSNQGQGRVNTSSSQGHGNTSSGQGHGNTSSNQGQGHANTRNNQGQGHTNTSSNQTDKMETS